jgi:hypothetical protein
MKHQIVRHTLAGGDRLGEIKRAWRGYRVHLAIPINAVSGFIVFNPPKKAPGTNPGGFLVSPDSES